jgi:hypothetical protein
VAEPALPAIRAAPVLSDSSDARLGDALAKTSGLGAGQCSRFEAIGTESDRAETFGHQDVTAY